MIDIDRSACRQSRIGEGRGLLEFSLEKLGTALEAGMHSIEIDARAGVQMGFGTDLLEMSHDFQSEELLLRSGVQKPQEILLAVTEVNAKRCLEAMPRGD